MNENNNNENNNKKPNSDGKIFFRILMVSLALTFIFQVFNASMAVKKLSEIKYSEFIDWVQEDKVEKVELATDKITIYPKAESLSEEQQKLFAKGGTPTYYTGYIKNDKLLDILEEHNVEYDSPIISNSLLLSIFVNWVMPILFITLIFTIGMRMISKKMGGSGGIMGVGKSNAKMYMQKETGVTFKDVAGQDEAKESLEEIIDFLHNPEKYNKIGARQPKGALLVGPPGTGKTLLAKAVAGEANVTFMSLSGSDFVEMFVGVGASRVRDLFKQAQSNAPCIVFIDEIDAIGKSRDNGMNSNDEREQTLNQLLAEMDGFDTSKGVVILAATNRPEVLDKALLRPGRFDRRIIVEKPDLIGRENILKVHASKVKIGADVNFNKMALATSGAVGADLANIVNEAALRAVRLGRDEVLQEDLMEAVEVVIAGKEKKDRILSEKEKRIVAFHEVGHALAAALQKNTQPVQKITIVPRTMGALGYTMQMPEEEHYLMSRDEIISEIVVLLAGRSAEEVEFNISTTGASNDIERASKLARSMISQYGMSEKFDMMSLESIENRYLDGRAVANCGDSTMADLDKEVLEVIRNAHKKAKEIISENREALTKISEYLIEKETITGEEFMDILKECNGEDIKSTETDNNEKLNINE